MGVLLIDDDLFLLSADHVRTGLAIAYING